MVQPSDFFGDEPAPASVPAEGVLWRWKSAKSDAPAAWFFVTISGAAADTLTRSTGVRGGFASIRVEARVGATIWRTSVFPSKNPPGFLLPIKAAVRRAEGICEGDVVRVVLTQV